MAAAAAAAGRAALVSTSESGAHRGALVSSVRAYSASARPGPSHSQFSQSGQPRLIAFSSFFGADVDRSVLRSSNGSAPRVMATIANEIAVDGSSNSTTKKVDVPFSSEKATPESPSTAAPSLETAASVFMADVANLIKLVDTRDIVELELKNKDYELVIRKKEALPPPPASQQFSNQGPHVMAHTMYPGFQPQPQPQIQSPPMDEEATPAPAVPSPVDSIPLAAEHPPMLSPMAGTFYRSPAPGEPRFVKVGDKVTKGQVVCIVEAMKLMNEIEADQSGTIVEIVAEDGKPVSIESPLFIIKP